VCTRPGTRQLFRLTGLDGPVPLARTLEGHWSPWRRPGLPPPASGRAGGPARRPVPWAGMLHPPQPGIGRLCARRPGGRRGRGSCGIPIWVLASQPKDQGPDVAPGRRRAGLGAHGPDGASAADDVAVPAQDRVRGDQQPTRAVDEILGTHN
jgi:hypothetical protein